MPTKENNMDPKNIKARTVNEYLIEVPEELRETLETVRLAILQAAPKAEEVISYNIPTYKYFGPLVHFAAFKDHLSFVVVSKTIADTFKKELKPFKFTGRTIHFSPENPLPPALVKKIVKARLKENEEANAQKEKAKRKK
jgi:uncharacterized protein YdhG (YjbR/CyaY superfamily)